MEPIKRANQPAISKTVGQLQIIVSLFSGAPQLPEWARSGAPYPWEKENHVCTEIGEPCIIFFMVVMASTTWLAGTWALRTYATQHGAHTPDTGKR